MLVAHYMNTRLFDHTGMQVSEVGLGCWQLGGADWGALDEKVAFDILAAAVDSGVNFFDTADVYGNGRSESIIGRFLKQSRREIFVATKLGRTSSLYPANYTEAGVRAATEASLKRLGVETLDLTQLHCIPPSVLRQGEVFDWLRKLQREGKIRHFGASVESMDEALLCVRQEGLVSLQIIFNIFRQKPIQALFGIAETNGIALIIRLPLASGLLGGKMSLQSRFASSDHRTYNRDGQAFNVGETFAGLPFEKGVALAEALKPLVPPGMNMAQMAQRWILDFDAVTVVIPGASRPEQAKDNASASAFPRLVPELHEKLRQFYEKEVAPHIRGPY
jgi:aryl-alcohol dehydrogenase-like predicted oxidoreductase